MSNQIECLKICSDPRAPTFRVNFAKDGNNIVSDQMFLRRCDISEEVKRNGSKRGVEVNTIYPVSRFPRLGLRGILKCACATVGALLSRINLMSIPKEGTKDRIKLEMLLRPDGATKDELNRATANRVPAFSFINDTRRLAKAVGGTPHWTGSGSSRRFWITKP